MLRIFSLLVLICIFACGLSNVNAGESSKKIVKSCYNDEDSPYVKFSSKTAYRVNQNKNIDNQERLEEGNSVVIMSF